MNYLAHIYLSFGNEELMVGNYITDALRGMNINRFSPAVQNGIRLHRKIDAFTDSHPLFWESKRKFSGEFDKFSGILVDIYYDHILARYFERFSEIPLEQYARQQYEVLRKYYPIFPDHAQRFFDYMTSRNILFEYSKLDGIELVLTHLSKRLERHGCSLQDSVPLFRENMEQIEKEFFAFFDELHAYSRDQAELLLK
ncbi:MAG: DUF479 domain-containing protein [Bacteroidetes bacterium]|nr:DUF479 domain-containing protein [Bacteroidota bacterium]